MEEVKRDVSFDLGKIFIYSSIGIFLFFVPIKINGQSQSLIYHSCDKLQLDFRPFIQICIVTCISLGILRLVLSYKEKESNIIGFKILLRSISLIIVISIYYGNKSLFFIRDDVMQIIDEMIMNLVTILPISAIFMTFILDYGLLDVVESYSHKYMKNMFKLSGKTVINIFMFIFTDCFTGIFMTNRLFSSGKIRGSEACILIFNFSLISLPMFSYISNELNISRLDIMIINFIVLVMMNIILCRIYPLNKKKKSYYIKTEYRETTHKKDKFKKGVNKYLKSTCNKSIFKNMFDNLEEAIYIIIDLIPKIVIVMCIGDIIIKNKSIVNLLGYMIEPFLNLLKIENDGQISHFIVNALFNDIIAIDTIHTNLSYNLRLLITIIICIKSVSITGGMLFIGSTNINISIKDFIILYIERILIILILYFLMYYFYIGYIM